MTTSAQRERRERNLSQGEGALEELVALGYVVTQLSQWHFRINNRLDVWPSTKKWRDKITSDNGEYTDLKTLVRCYLSE